MYLLVSSLFVMWTVKVESALKPISHSRQRKGFSPCGLYSGPRAHLHQPKSCHKYHSQSSRPSHVSFSCVLRDTVWQSILWSKAHTNIYHFPVEVAMLHQAAQGGHTPDKRMTSTQCDSPCAPPNRCQWQGWDHTDHNRGQLRQRDIEICGVTTFYWK